MKKGTILSFVLSLFFLVQITAQEKLELPSDAFGKTTMQCFEANGIHNQYENATNQLFVMLKQQYANKNVPVDLWVNLEAVKPEALQNIKIRMVQAYRVHFTDADMNEMLSFYSSDEGKKMISNNASLTDDDRKIIKDFFNTTTGQKIIESQSSLTKMIGNISETWSAELYKSQIDKLAGKGFNL